MSWEIYTSKTLIYSDPIQFTSVYKAWDASNSRFAALKEQCFPTPEERDQVTKEAELMQQIQHPNVCEVYAMQKWETSEGFLFGIAMEWLDGDLEKETEEMRRRGERWGENDAVRLLWEITEVMAKAEGLEICHRDIKPTNLFKNPTAGGFKIADFGSAKTASMATLSHTLAGTPQFLSPELRAAYAEYLSTQICPNAMYNPYKSDVYSLGLTVAYMLKPEICGHLQNDKYVKTAIGEMDVSGELKGILLVMIEGEERFRPDFVTLEGMIKRKFSLEALLEAINEGIAGNNFDNAGKRVEKAFSWNWEMTGSVFFPCELCKKQEELPKLAQFSDIGNMKLICCSCKAAKAQIPQFTPPKAISRLSNSLPQRSELEKSSKARSSIGPKGPTIAAAPVPLGSYIAPKQTYEDPQCTPRNCSRCQLQFALYPLADWRARILGTDNTWKCVKTCSEVCMQSLISENNPENLDDICVKCEKNAAKSFILTCKRHYLCQSCSKSRNYSSFLPGNYCLKCKDEELAYLDVTSRCTFLISPGRQSYIRVADKSNTTSWFLSMWHLKAWAQSPCHYCSFPVRSCALSFFIYCGDSLHCVCSPACLDQHVRATEAHPTCPKCNETVSGLRLKNYTRADRLIMTSREIRGVCRVCKTRRGEVHLECGHDYCSECLIESKDMYPGRPFHCLFCGQIQTAGSVEDLIRG